jgi:hypothetical protein
VTIDPRLAARLRSQGLSGRKSGSVVDVVRRILALQAQDGRGVRLAIRSRTTGLTATDVDAALNDRALVVSWLNRGTLHLVTAEDYWWLHPLTTPQLRVSNQRRLRQEGVGAAPAERGVDVVADALEDGPQTRPRLIERLDAAGVPSAGQAFVHIMLLATIRGIAVRGPMVDGDHAFVSVRRWLGEPPAPLEEDAALARLGERYLVGHGPADAEDLAKWAGITLGRARRAMSFVEPNPPPTRAALPPPTLLGSFDPVLHGWASRDAVVGAHRGVVTVNGIFRPTVLVDGRAVATWTMPNGVVTIAPLEPLPERAMPALEREAADVLRFLGLPTRPLTIAD